MRAKKQIRVKEEICENNFHKTLVAHAVTPCEPACTTCQAMSVDIRIMADKFSEEGLVEFHIYKEFRDWLSSITRSIYVLAAY